MVGTIKEKVDEEGTQLYIYRCKEDGVLLWEELNNGILIRGTDCPHYEWTPVGNGCYPQSLDEEICEGVNDIKEKAVKKKDEGLTIWFLVPRSQ